MDPNAEPVRLRTRPEAWAAIPGTPYEVRVGTLRQRIASRAPGEIPRSMLTVVLTLREGRAERLREHLEPGEHVEFRGLRLRLLRAEEDGVELEVGPAPPAPPTCPCCGQDEADG